MIKLFDTAKKVVFFPVRWANAVTLWIQNVRSPDDSLKITNTCSPKEGNSLGLTVNMQKIYDGIKSYFKDAWVTPSALREILDDSCDNNSLEITEGKFHINEEWLAEHAGEGNATLKPFTVQCVTKKSGSSTVVDYWKIYLPSLTVGIGKTDYAIQTGTSTGCVSPITDEDGWYRLYGISAGNVFLNDASTEQTAGGAKNYKVVFSNSALSGANKVSIKIAATSFSSEVATVVQCENPVKGYFGMCDTEHDGTNGIDICGTMSSNTSTSNFISAGQKLVQKTWERGVSVLQHNTGTTNNPVWVDDVDAQGNTQLCGVKLRMITRVVRIVDRDFFLYRELVFDKNGMLRTVSEEKAAYGEMNDLNY